MTAFYPMVRGANQIGAMLETDGWPGHVRVKDGASVFTRVHDGMGKFWLRRFTVAAPAEADATGRLTLALTTALSAECLSIDNAPVLVGDPESYDYWPGLSPFADLVNSRPAVLSE